MRPRYFIFFLVLILLLVSSEWFFLQEYFELRRGWILFFAFLIGVASICSIAFVVKRSAKDPE